SRLLAKRDEAGALQDFSTAITLDPTHAAALLARANIYARNEDSLAVVDFTAYIALKPTEATGFCARAQALFRLGKYDKSLADFAQAVRLNRTDAAALFGRGAAKTQLDDPSGKADLAAAAALRATIAADMAKTGVKPKSGM